jgi:hypothetical protein
MIKITTTLAIIILFLSCKKNKKFGFEVYELVLDTLLKADTVYNNSDIFFKSNENYSNISWNVGSDPRVFTSQSLNFRFTSSEVLPVKLKGDKYNLNCILEENSFVKSVVIVDNNNSNISPLVGTFLGSNTDNLPDTFSIKIKYWYGQRYSWWPNGAYSVENLPKGYLDSTQNWNGFQRPEIKGIIASNGFKNIAIDKSGNEPALGIKGYGNLRNGIRDSLIFSYTILDTTMFNQTGQITYLKKIFKGIKK